MIDAANFSGLKVMVIDDSQTIRHSAEIFLAQIGCTVILAEDGVEALSKLEAYQPALIFCDDLMPRLDGYQTSALIKKSPRFCDTPLILLSSQKGLFDLAKRNLSDFDAYLSKPFTKSSLLGAILSFA